MTIQLSERHVIKPSHSLFNECQSICLKTARLYNVVNYVSRQQFFAGKLEACNKGIRFQSIKSHECYQALPRKVSNGVKSIGKRLEILF